MAMLHRSGTFGRKMGPLASDLAGVAQDVKGRLGWGSRIALIGTGWKFARRHPGAAIAIGGVLALLWMARANDRRPQQLH